jgi:hypothetical protein
VNPAGTAPAGPGPDRHDDGSDDLAHLRALVESERVVGSEAEINDALDGLAALLLDLHAVKRDQGCLLTPSSRSPRPDVPRQRRPTPSLAEGTTA